MKRLCAFLPLLSLCVAATAEVAQVAVVTPEPFGEAAARTFPYSMTGKLIFAQGDEWFQGSGTLIRPNAVLTAAHNLWDSERGFSTDLVFRRAFYGGPSAPDRAAGRVYVLSGYRESARKFGATDLRTFSDDLGALVFSEPVAGGSFAGWWANPSALVAANPGIALGYGAELHSGELLLAVSPAAGYEPLVDSFFANRSLIFESGMSGGPVFVTNPQGTLSLAGIIVAGAVDLTSGGIRALDEEAAAFIRKYLK